jgi:hypothetical protein
VKKQIILLMFLLLPSVYASSFTGIFIDYGNDTGTDGLFDYLTIQAELDITNAAKEYLIYGYLKDSHDNYIEYENCWPVASTGIQNMALQFDGPQLYRNKVNGPYTLAAVELFSLDDCKNGGGFPPDLEDSRINAHTTQAYSYQDFQRGEPAIHCNDSPCVASSSLLRSRDSLNTPEPNAYNTIDGCQDGTAGSYLSSESIESISVTSLNHTFFKTGDTVLVEMQVYCAYTFDKLNFVYSNDAKDINWVVKDSKQCTSTGLSTFSTTFALGTTVEQHGVRGVFTFNTNPLTVCGQDDAQYQWADTDDIAILVRECRENTDCAVKDCDYLDGCYSGTYRNYDDKQLCLPDFHCDQSACSDYSNIVTDNDGDGYDIQCDNDCNDANKSINPGQTEICDNQVDDNCDGYIDANDPSCQGTYPITLTQGWNLLSLPKIDDNSISEIVNLFGTDYDRIAALKQGKWYVYDRLDALNSNLEALDESSGFWIEANKNATFFINDEAAALTTFNLVKGWNQIGYPSIEQQDLSLVFQDVMDDIELIYIYNQEFQSLNPDHPSALQINPGTGIFVKVKSDISWYFDTKFRKGNITYDLPLAIGWNAISLPLGSNKTVSELFGTTLYYLKNTQWEQTEPTDYINYSNGYWLKSSTSSLPIQGHPINTLTYNINPGWNIINYPLTEEKSPGVWLQNVESNIDAVFLYDNDEWQTYIPGKPQNSLTMCKPGKALFLKAKNPATWHYNGNNLVTT